MEGLSRQRVVIACAILLVLSVILLAIPAVRRQLHPLTSRLRGRITLEQRLLELRPAVQPRLRAMFQRAGVPYPPARLVLVGLKDERRLEVYAAGPEQSAQWVHGYPIQAASGTLGPKLREGDRQVPEGVYRIVSLNPNSRFHVSLEVSYPNEADRLRAVQDGRPVDKLGGDIFIHGGAASVGCLAMGDPAAEELFVLAADTGLDQVTVVLAPLDLHVRRLPSELDHPSNRGLYQSIQAAMPAAERHLDDRRSGVCTDVAQAVGLPVAAARHLRPYSW